jgi:hypothetical protein
MPNRYSLRQSGSKTHARSSLVQSKTGSESEALNINDIIFGIQNMLTRLIGENIEFKVRCSQNS